MSDNTLPSHEKLSEAADDLDRDERPETIAPESALVALFARANHPLGYGYGTGRAHGYVVVGVRCQTPEQVQAVVKHIREQGFDKPDDQRGIYPNGKPDKPHERTVWSENILRWYSGGPFDWDYLTTISGEEVTITDDQRWQMAGSRGDNRFFWIYEADEVLD